MNNAPPPLEALRDCLCVVIANAEVARLAAQRDDVRERLGRILAAAWEANSLLTDKSTPAADR